MNREPEREAPCASTHPPRATAFTRERAPGPVEPAPSQLFVGVRGSATLRTATHGDIAIRPRDLVLVSRQSATLSGSGFDVVVGHFDRAAAASRAVRHVRSVAASPLHHSLASELDAPRAGRSRAVLALLDALLTHVTDPVLPRGVDAHVARALEAMTDDPSRRWTVADLAHVAGLSRAPFARRFQEATGQSPLRWLAAHRMQLAADRLTATDDALAQVATLVGYESEFAFAKAFRRHFGEAPGTFRRRMTTPTLACAA